MAEPHFDPDERYIIAYYESGGGAAGGWTIWLLHAAMAGLFGYGLMSHNDAVAFTAFGMLIFWRIYEASQQPRFVRATRGVLTKYAQRIEELSPPRDGDE